MYRRLFGLLLVAAFAVTLAPAALAQARRGPGPDASPSAAPVAPFNRLRWREIGPAVSGGRVTSVVGSARDPKLYYVGSAGGGVWKSINGGATWSPVFDDAGISSIGAVAIDPSNDEIVWAGTG